MGETLDDLLNELNYFVPSQAHLTFQAGSTRIGTGDTLCLEKVGRGSMRGETPKDTMIFAFRTTYRSLLL